MLIRYRYDLLNWYRYRNNIFKWNLTTSIRLLYRYWINIELTSNRYCYNIDTILKNSDIISILIRYWFNIEMMSKWYRNNIVKINLKMLIRCRLKTPSFCKESCKFAISEKCQENNSIWPNWKNYSRTLSRLEYV